MKQVIVLGVSAATLAGAVVWSLSSEQPTAESLSAFQSWYHGGSDKSSSAYNWMDFSNDANFRTDTEGTCSGLTQLSCRAAALSYYEAVRLFRS